MTFKVIKEHVMTGKKNAFSYLSLMLKTITFYNLSQSFIQ